MKIINLLLICVCFLLTFISLKIIRPNTIYFFPIIVLQFIAFLSFFLFFKLFNYLTDRSFFFKYIYSCLMSFVLLFTLVWMITGKLLNAISLLFSKESLGIFVPYLISHVITIFILVVRRRRAKVF